MKSYSTYIKELQDKVYSFGNIQITVPDFQKSLIQQVGATINESEIYIDPEDSSYGLETETHITVRYGTDITEPEQIRDVYKCLPFEVDLDGVSYFSGEKYDVLKIDVISEGLIKTNALLGTLANFPGENHKEYKPHCTIAYLKKGCVHKYVGLSFRGMSFIATSINFINTYRENFNIDSTGEIHRY